MSDEKPVDARAAKLDSLKKRIEELEDKHLTLYEKLEAKKLDIFFMGPDSPRGLHLKEEAKKILGELVAARRAVMVAGREYANMFEESIDESTKWAGEATSALAETSRLAAEVKDIVANVMPAAPTPVPTDRPPPSDP